MKINLALPIKVDRFLTKATRLFLIALVFLVVFAVVFWIWFTFPAPRGFHARSGQTVPTNVVWLDTGLTPEEQVIWHHLSEGSEAQDRDAEPGDDGRACWKPATARKPAGRSWRAWRITDSCWRAKTRISCRSAGRWS